MTPSARIPVRMPPLPGEAIDSWLDAYARRLHVAAGEILAAAGLSWDCASTANGQRPWLHGLDAPALTALGEVTGIPPDDLAGMTLARYEGTGLTGAANGNGHRRPRWWRQPAASRYCPRCLAANGGRWMLAWRIPWAFACPVHHDLLADGCPDCGRWQHLRAPAGPREPGRCDLTGLHLPPARPFRGRRPPCSRDPATAPAVPLHEDGRVLAAWQHADGLIAALLAAQGDQARLAAVQQDLDDLHTVGRAAVSALYRSTAPPAAATGVLTELGVRQAPPGRAAVEALYATARGPGHRSAPVVAFGTAVADIMLHGRRDDPDPEITAWIADAAAERGQKTSPADTLARWGNVSPALKTALVRPLQPRMGAFLQLRHGIPAGTTRIPGIGQARPQARAAIMPPLLWDGWALRLMPPSGFTFLKFRSRLSMLLMTAAAGASGPREAAKLLGLPPAHASGFGDFLGKLQERRALEAILSCACQLAVGLDEQGAPIDYARRRQLRSLTQARLDVAGWRREAACLPDPRVISSRPRSEAVRLVPAADSEPFARLRLIEILTGIHPGYLTGPLRLPAARYHKYAQFILGLPEQMARFLGEHARRVLDRVGISEPLTWEPPADWVAGVTWPGPAPDGVTPQALHPLLQASLLMGAITARLGTTIDHVYLAAARHPAPQLPPGNIVLPGPQEPASPQRVRDLVGQGLGFRAIARTTGWRERDVKQLIREAGLKPASAVSGEIDPLWLAEQYQTRGRSLIAIATESGIPPKVLGAAARNAGIPIRPRGIARRGHPLATL